MDDSAALKVSEALRVCNAALQEFDFYIEGEVANYSVSRGRFVWFDLKDEEEEALLRCFMMLHVQNIPLEDGMRVIIHARPTIFAKSGKFTFTVHSVEAKGDGSLKRAFQLLYAKLEKEGLFSAERKRALPAYPSRIGIISSEDAAGYGDFTRIARSRFPGVHYLFCNVAVQGRDAEKEITAAFAYLNEVQPLDAIVLVRGGGSMEDLHAFNSEAVARAIARSRVPVVVGVGHERDVTIADYVADVRASTPSNAAQLLLPSLEEVQAHILSLTQVGQRRTEGYIAELRFQTADSLRTMQQAVHHRIHTLRQSVAWAANLGGYLGGHIRAQREAVYSSYRQIRLGITHSLQSNRTLVASLVRSVDALSPQRTLERGYSITKRADGRIITSAKSVPPGTVLETRLADGTLRSLSE